MVLLLETWAINRCLDAELCLTLFRPMDCSPPGSSGPGFPRKNTGVDCHFLLQGIFPTQGWKHGLLHCRWILYQLSYQGKPGSLAWLLSTPASLHDSCLILWTSASRKSAAPQPHFHLVLALQDHILSGLSSGVISLRSLSLDSGVRCPSKCSHQPWLHCSQNAS